MVGWKRLNVTLYVQLPVLHLLMPETGNTFFFDALLTVYLNIILVINQLNPYPANVEIMVSS